MDVNIDTKLEIILNHSWDVDIESVSANQGYLFLLLISSQNIDSV